MRRLAFVLLLASCNSAPPAMKDAGPPDLKPAIPPDMAMPDLQELPDLAMPDIAKLPGPCMGTAAAGTCVDDFFAGVALCFPTAGACTASSSAPMVYSTCWMNGSQRLESGTQGQIKATWKNGMQTCMVGTQVVTGWIFFANNQMMSLDTNDRYTCPSGVTAKVAKGVCPALDALLGLGGPPQNCTSVDGGGGC